MPDAARRQFVEEMGLLFEAERFPRIAGRVLGWLLVAEEAQSLEAIGTALGVTKASVSTNARMLESRGLIERVSHPGDRRDHYRIVADLPSRTLEARVARMRRVRDVLARGEAAMQPTSKAVRTRFRHMVTAYDFVLQITSRALDELPERLARVRPTSSSSR